jgi:hypothetical protein
MANSGIWIKYSEKDAWFLSTEDRATLIARFREEEKRYAAETGEPVTDHFAYDEMSDADLTCLAEEGDIEYRDLRTYR